jgi:hypothetical protein
MGVKPPSTSQSKTRPKDAVALSIPESKYVIKLRFEVHTPVKMLMLVFSVVTLCGLIGRYQNFRGSSALKMEALCSSETLASTYKSTWCCNPEDQHTKINFLCICYRKYQK